MRDLQSHKLTHICTHTQLYMSHTIHKAAKIHTWPLSCFYMSGFTPRTEAQGTVEKYRRFNGQNCKLGQQVTLAKLRLSVLKQCLHRSSAEAKHRFRLCLTGSKSLFALASSKWTHPLLKLRSALQH